MISSVNMANYYRVVSMSNSLSSFIRMATIARSQIDASISSTLSSNNGIGNKVDIFA